MASPAVDYARQNQQRFLSELKDLLRIPSVSTLEEHKSDVQKAAEFVASELRRIGMEHVEIIPTKGHPLIYADWLNAPGKPTVLCYAHYDVQPPDPLDEWVTPPFEPTERNNNIYARGAVDDKGQLWMEIKAIEALMKGHNGKLPLNVEAMNVDLLSLTAHKIYGPKGIGALYVRRKPPLGLKPLIYGGGQEFGLRSGTLATHQIVGMGLAFEIAERDRQQDVERIGALRDKLWAGIASIGDVELNGHPTDRVAGLLNISFRGVEGESLQFALRELAVSAGSACSSASEEASYVLRALGRSDQLAQSSLRFSLGRFTTAEQVETAIAAVKREVTRLRSYSPPATSEKKS